jgi:hypothetical protein
MTDLSLAHPRLWHQQLVGPRLASPGEVVAWLGAVQAQDYLAALWAVGLRLPVATEACVEQALADKTIVRTWFMRGTLHFVPPVDIRWMLALMAPRLHMLANNTIRYQRLGLDEATFATSAEVLAKTLQGGQHLTRVELAAALESAGIATEGLRLSMLLQRAQADALICHGLRRGKQYTFVLLDDWLPPGPMLPRDAALAELARRYFISHGPATLQDFAWWTGLTTANCKAGLADAASYLAQETRDGQTYWLAPSLPPAGTLAPAAHLLPCYDEYIVGYRDRSAIINPEHLAYPHPRDNILFSHTLALGGRIAGIWQRTLGRAGVSLSLQLFEPLGEADQAAITSAAERYAAFLELPIIAPQSD